MFKNAVVIFAVIASVAGKPHLIGAPVALATPSAVVAAPVVTATSSQAITRNYNGIATAPILAPAAFIAPVAAPPVLAKAVAPVAVSAPPAAKSFSSVPFAAHIAKYAAAYSTPLVAAPSVSSVPLHYAAAPVTALW